jgi:hypothetical protein
MAAGAQELKIVMVCAGEASAIGSTSFRELDAMQFMTTASQMANTLVKGTFVLVVLLN